MKRLNVLIILCSVLFIIVGFIVVIEVINYYPSDNLSESELSTFFYEKLDYYPFNVFVQSELGISLLEKIGIYPPNVIGKSELGKVSLEGPYGNNDSENKIAIIVGVHPLESNSHESLLKHMRQYNDSLNNSYYIYVVNVTKDKDNRDKGRMNGQILARDYVVPDINSENYTLAIDFHSNRGVYSENNFIIAPLNDKESKNIGKNIIENISGMKFLNFTPDKDDSPTSPNYVSIPILKNGTPTLIYETHINESENVTDKFISEFILNLDKVEF